MRPSITLARRSASLAQLNRCELYGDEFGLVPIGSLRHPLPSQDLCRMGKPSASGLMAAVFSTYRIGTWGREIFR